MFAQFGAVVLSSSVARLAGWPSFEYSFGGIRVLASMSKLVFGVYLLTKLKFYLLLYLQSPGPGVA